MTEYQRLYAELFRLVMARKPGEPETPAFDALRRRMDALPGTPAQKEAWGRAAGTELYARAVYQCPTSPPSR